jgi:membrane protease YdiL (CAAX protease family)
VESKSFNHNHPLTSYFCLAFLISWLGGFAAVGSKFFGGSAMDPGDYAPLFLAMLIGPSLAGILMTALSSGKSGLKNLFARMRLWRVEMRWYIAALLIPPGLIMVILLGLSSFGAPKYSPRFFPLGILAGIGAGFFEEIGWTGFAFPRLRLKYAVLSAAICLGIIHVVWHLLPDYLGASGSRSSYWLPHFLTMMLLSMTALRILIAWIYVNSGSVLLAQLTHASSTGFLAALVPWTLTPAQDTLFYLFYGIGLWVVVFFIIIGFGKNLQQNKDKTCEVGHE